VGMEAVAEEEAGEVVEVVDSAVAEVTLEEVEVALEERVTSAISLVIMLVTAEGVEEAATAVAEETGEVPKVAASEEVVVAMVEVAEAIVLVETEEPVAGIVLLLIKAPVTIVTNNLRSIEYTSNTSP